VSIDGLRENLLEAIPGRLAFGSFFSGNELGRDLAGGLQLQISMHLHPPVRALHCLADAASREDKAAHSKNRWQQPMIKKRIFGMV
jgi:hypothetical protein